MTNYSRSVLKSNGPHHSKNLPVKFDFSPIDTSATIAKKLPPQRCFKPLLIPIFNFPHKRPTFAFTGESGYTLGFAQRIVHKGTHGETRGVSDGGWYHYPRSVPHVHEHPRAGCQNGVFCRFWALTGCAHKEHREPSGQRCAYARRCPEASRPRWAAGTYSFVTAWSFLHRYQSANSWNFQSRLLDAPTSIAKPSVFCYNILKSR